MKSTKIYAEIVADSVSPQGDRITTYLLTFPRFILAELNTHRMFSRNSASSRAIPFEKMVKMVEEDPFIPIAWQKNHKGMQGSEYWGKEDWVVDQPNVSQINVHNCAIGNWLQARDNAVSLAKQLNRKNITKQLCNRLLEPFMWHTTLVSATEFDNFFELRCPQYQDIYTKNKYYKSWKTYLQHIEDYQTLNYAKNLDVIGKLRENKSQAEIHIQALAEAMYDAYNESTPKKLQAGEWHIPFGDRVDEKELNKLMPEIQPASLNWYIEQLNMLKLKISTARCARLSYMTFDGEIDYQKDIELHDRLLADGHMSPFEHCARAMNNAEYESFYKGQIGLGGESGWCNNFRGFIPYRYLIENSKKLIND